MHHRQLTCFLLSLLGAALLLAGCGPNAEVSSPTPGAANTPAPPRPPAPTSAPPAPGSEGGNGGVFPIFGHADDFSWIAGQVLVTRIQGGCVYVRYDATDANAQVHVSGPSWDKATTVGIAANGAFVILAGHLVEAGAPAEMCPGRAYTVTRVLANPAGAEYTPPPAPPTPTAQSGPIVSTSVPGTGPIEGPPLVGPGSTPPATPGAKGVMTPGSDGAVTVTETDTGRTVEMHVGDTLQLKFQANGYSWEMRAADPAVLGEDTVGNPVGGQATRFKALQAGQTTLQGTGTLPCHHVNPPCAAPTLGLELQIVVR